MTNYDRAALAFEDPGAGWPRCGKCDHESDDHGDEANEEGCLISGCTCDRYSQERDDPGEAKARARGLI